MEVRWPVLGEAVEYARRIREHDATLIDLIFRNDPHDDADGRFFDRSEAEPTVDRFRAFLGALREHGEASSIRRVIISRQLLDFFCAFAFRGPDLLLDTLRALGTHLPALEEFELEPGNYYYPASDVMACIGSSLPRLRRLVIGCNVQLSRATSEEIANLLRRAVHLEEFCTRALQVPYRASTEGILTPLVTALAGIETLKILDIRVRTRIRFSLVSQETLRALFRSRSLCEIALVNVGLRNSDAETIATELSTNTSLEKLDLSGNRYIEKDGYRSIYSMMEKQLCITEFRIDEIGFRDHSEATRNLCSAISSFAKLNAAGRRHILPDENADRSALVDLLAVGTDSVDALLHVVRAKPGLCCKESATT